MKVQCESIQQNTTLRLEVSGKDGLGVYAMLTNRSNVSLWFPQEREPSYHVDDKAQIITISYGYFEEVYGRYRGRYMLPPMRAVSPHQEYKLEISDRRLKRKISAPGFRTRLQARVALRAFAENDVRGEQELNAYLNESCVLKSSETSFG